jgi:nucleotide-binding universal stress UspA family protein
LAGTVLIVLSPRPDGRKAQPVHGIVVGISESAAGAAALDWALEQAACRQVPLVAVRAWDIPAYGPYYSVGSALRSTSPDFELTELEIARNALAQALQRVPAAAQVEATAVATRGRPPEVLVAAAEQTELLVLGTRGVGALSRVVHLGSVTSSVLHHAHGPVAVIPDAAPQAPASPSRVVVGVDGSKVSLRALAWAVSHARVTGATLVPLSVGGGADDERELASLRAAAEAAGSGEVAVEPQVRRGSVSQELLAAAAEADVLVLGSRGRGGFASLLLGSTSSQVAGHSSRPVVVVRPE